MELSKNTLNSYLRHTYLKVFVERFLKEKTLLQTNYCPPSLHYNAFLKRKQIDSLTPELSATFVIKEQEEMATNILEEDFRKLDLNGSNIQKLRVIGGNSKALEALRELLLWPKLYAEKASQLGVKWPNGLLLHGPPGCGKTLMTKVFQSLVDKKVVSATSVFGSYLGESEKNLRDIFDKAIEGRSQGKTTILFFDEIDSLCPKRSSERPHESRVVSQLLTLMDEASLQNTVKEQDGRVVIIGATNRPNALDPALRRPGRFDKEVEVSVPSHPDRLEILKVHSAQMPIAKEVDLSVIAGWTHGYSGADLSALCREAAMHSISTSASSEILLEDFSHALRLILPSVGKGYEVEVLPVHWEDIGGLKQVKKRLRQAAEWPLLHRDAFQRLGLKPAKGILLYGPPGCCKTTLARAVATGCKAHLIPLSCAQVFSMYSGEGERIIREAFHRCRLTAPSILLLDEVESIATARLSDESKTGSAVGAQLLSCLLTEMDGIEQTNNVLVLASTNQPWKLDHAFIRSGRIDMTLFIGLPDEDSRKQILSIHTKNTPMTEDVDLASLAQRTDLFTGAELAALCSEAAMCALREDVVEAKFVSQEHFEKALIGITPATTLDVIESYRNWGSKHKFKNFNP
eukprot:g935.t1